MKKNLKGLLFILAIIAVFCSFGVISSSASDAELVVPYVVAKNTEEGVFIKWTKDTDAESYDIYRNSDSLTATKIGQTLSDVNFFTDTTAVSGKSYTYFVLPCAGTRLGECTSQFTITYLAQPRNITAQNASTGVKITWTKSAGATKYNIYRKLPTDASWSHAGFVGDKNTFIDTAVNSGTEYLYSVRARNATAVSSYDNKGVKVAYLKSPELVSLKSVTDGLYLNWSAVPDATAYVIYRRTAGKTWQKLISVKGTVTGCVDKTVEANKAYAYTVRAVKGTAVSGFYSGIASKFIPIVKVASVTNHLNGLQVKWAKSPYATGYKIYRKEAGATSWTRVGTVKGRNTTTFIDKKTTNAKNYTYTVIVVSGSFQSTFDNVGKSGKYVAVPSDISVSRSGAKNVVSWTKISGGTYYYIYRRNNGDTAWKALARVGNTNKYTDSTAKASQVYEYSVRAGIVTESSKAYSAYSEPVKSSGIDPNGKMIALTYDDGPSNSVTNRILDVLEDYNAKATFFVIGSRISSNSEPMVRAYNMGCEIANHTYNHVDLPSYSDSTVTSEVTSTSALIKQYTGAYPNVFRAPGGSTSSRVCELIGMPIIYWSVDTRDWEHRTASTTVSTIKNNVQDGSIILMHDIYDATASASETIIPWLIDEGYQLVTISELMQYRGINMQDGVTYYNAYP